MGISVFQHPSFVWVCAVLAGGCLAAAVAVGARAFWTELAARFLRMPAAGKAAFVAFVAVATAAAQKPGNVATDSTDSHGLGEAVLSTDYTDLHGLGSVVLDRIDKIDRIEETETVSAETSDTLSNPVNPVKENLCASAAPREESVTADDIARGYRLVEVRTNETISYELPTNGAVVGTWHLTDAYDAVVRVGLGEGEGRRKKEEGRSAELSSSFLPAQHDKDASAATLLPSSFFPFPSQQDASATTLLPSSLFLFPLRHHVVTSLWAHVWGKARPQLKNASNELVAVGAPMFARHGVSRLWTAATTNGTVLLTWEKFFLGNPYEVEVRGGGGERMNEVEAQGGGGERADSLSDLQEEQECLSNHSPPQASTSTFSHPSINAQLELFPSGDFIARSNEVERVYRRVNPDDWDDDGIPNGEDEDPRLAADEAQFGPHQTLPEEANANAYCWVDLVVPQANALVTFAGDGASNLADPSFIAKSGEVNRVTLLIGKTYRVTCPLPFRIAAKSIEEIEESWQSDGSLLLRWPVSVGCESLESSEGLESLGCLEGLECLESAETTIRANPSSAFTLLAAFRTFAKLPEPPKPSKRFLMSVVPSGLGGLFDWTTHCCSISGTAYSFEQTCRDGCACSGCTTEGFFEYEGYQLRVYGPACPCWGASEDPKGSDDEDDDPPSRGVSVYFTKSVIFLEDEYESAPGETVPWQSTETELVCAAAGGPSGGRVRIEIEGADNLIQYTGPTLPFELSLAAGEALSFEIRYRAAKESGSANDIKVTATFVENETEWEQESRDSATAVKVTVKPRVYAPENEKDFRHRFGIGELVECAYKPVDPSVSPVKSGGGTVIWKPGTYEYHCPLRAESNGFGLSGGGAKYIPTTSVVEPCTVLAKDVWYAVGSVGIGQAGGILLTMNLYVLPLDVSFSGIRIEEVPDIGGSHSGYFADTFFMSEWFHGEGQGAGDWLTVFGDNRFLNDEAGFKRALPQLDSTGAVSTTGKNGWTNGNLTWEVPCGWAALAVEKGDEPVGTFSNGAQQVMTIDAQGNVDVKKHGNAVRREIGGGIILNGVRKQ